MKRFNIFLALFAVVTLTGCHKDLEMPTTPDNEIDIPINPTQRFIQFDADITNGDEDTRGALVEGTILQDDFMVLGYQYPGTWAAEKVFATPNVFDATPQLVEYDGEFFSYKSRKKDANGNLTDEWDYLPKVWTGNKYSFFAYYPSEHPKIKLFDDGTTVKQGEPYIVYELPISSKPIDLIDVMTAAYVDTGVASSSSVALQFHHRLSAVDIGARNYYKYNHDQNTETPDKLVTIEISSLQLDLSNIMSTSAKIYLDHTKGMELNYKSPREAISYVMVGSAAWAPPTFDVIPNTAADRAIRLVTTQAGENASSILLLPQEEKLNGTVTLTYKKKFTDDDGTVKYQRINVGDNRETYYTWTTLPTDPNGQQYYEFKPTLPINFSKELVEGRRYFIELTFTSDAVSVNIVAADEWNTLPDVNYEFE